jgi:hypothetical protein
MQSGAVTRSSRTEAASSLAAGGWFVFPLHTHVGEGQCSCGDAECVWPDNRTAAKHPRTAHGKDDATTDTEQVDAWWKRWPDANIGIRTGDGLVVIDDDGPAAQAWLDDQPTLPSTLRVRTHRGWQWYFEVPEGVRTRNRAKIAPDMDVRGDGGYVVAPPSEHASGHIYAWEDKDVPVAPCPDWLLELVREPEPVVRPLVVPKVAGDITPYGRAALEGELEKLRSAGEGTRNETLFLAAAALSELVAGGELPEGLVRDELTSLALGVGLKAGETTGTIDSGFNHGTRQPREAPPKRAKVTAQLGTRQPEEAPDDPDTVLEVARAAVNPSPNGWKRLSAAELLAMQFDPIRWAVPGMLPEGLTVFGGRPKARKSWLMLQMAIARATGGVFLGERLEAMPVVYFALEDGPRRLADRLRALECPGDVDGLVFQCGMPPIGKGGVEYVSELVEAAGAGLVVIDTISRALDTGVGRGVDQDKNADMTAILNPLQRFALERGLALVVVDHLRKTGISTERNPVEEVMGSTAKVGVADTIWGLYRKKGEHRGQLSIIGRDVEERDLVVEFAPTPAAWQMVGDAEKLGRSDAENRYLSAFEEVGEPADVRALAGFLEVKQQSCSEQLRRMVDKGLLEVTIKRFPAGGKKNLYHRLKKGSDAKSGGWDAPWWDEHGE